MILYGRESLAEPQIEITYGEEGSQNSGGQHGLQRGFVFVLCVCVVCGWESSTIFTTRNKTSTFTALGSRKKQQASSPFC